MSSLFGSISSKETTPKQSNTPVAVKSALENGDQLFLHKQVVDQMKEVGNIIEVFKNDDGKGLLSIFEKYNDKLGVQIPDPVKKSLLAFHTAVLDNLEGADRDAAFTDIMNKPSAAFAALGKTFAKDVDRKRDDLFRTEFMKNNTEMQDSIGSILNNVKDLRVKYKYFEYKYIEMNIFLILFVQKMFQAMDDFTQNVIAFNKLRDANRENIMKETLKMMVDIMKSSDIEMNPTDFDHIMNMMEQVRGKVVDSDKKLQQKMTEMTSIVTANMSDFLNAFVGATKDQLSASLGRGSPSPVSTLPANASLNSMQYGGFLRDGSLLPQAFYELDKSS